MIYIGVDVGRQGGISVINDQCKLLEAHKMPLKKNGSTSGRELLRIFVNVQKKYPNEQIHVIYEKLNSFFGIQQSGIIGVSREVGGVEFTLDIVKLPCTDVAPRKWQNFIFAGEKQLYKTVKIAKKPVQKLDTKRMAAVKFVKLFPDYDKIKVITKNTGTLRDGIVDAALIAVYGKRNNF